jgi:predicted transcriptional regulator of viral defense system
MLPASYISLHSALAYYGMIPEYVPITTSVTTARPANWETPLGIYHFRHIQIDFFDGYRLEVFDQHQRAFIASPEKALLDLVYLQPGGDALDYLVELRLSNLERLNWRHLERLAVKIDKNKLMRAILTLRELAGEEGEFKSL